MYTYIYRSIYTYHLKNKVSHSACHKPDDESTELKMNWHYKCFSDPNLHTYILCINKNLMKVLSK